METVNDRTVIMIALKDMREYLKNNFPNPVTYTKDGELEVWAVFPSSVYNKETRQLNRQLGITNINYFGNKNGRFKGKSKKSCENDLY